MSSYEFTYDVTPDLAKVAARKYIWRRAGLWLILNFIVLLSCLFLLVAGNRNWYVFVLPAIATVKLWAWLKSYLKSGASVEKVTDRKVTVYLNENDMQMNFAQVETKVSWSHPMSISKYKTLWLITFLDTNDRTCIPVDALSVEVKTFIENKVLENGGTVA